MTGKSPVKLIFGGGGIGKGNISHTWTTGEEAPWVTVSLLGESKAAEKNFIIDTKILIADLNILYSHMPDAKVPIGESNRAFDKQLKAGNCKEIGLCNYDASQMKEWLDVCERNGYAKPIVWQGQYNAMKRFYEEDLFPLLRKHGIRIIAYSPLVGGFLTRKASFAKNKSSLTGGRWDEGLFPIILGTTKIEQLRSSVEFCKKGTLSEELVEACKMLWRDADGVVEDMFSGVKK